MLHVVELGEGPEPAREAGIAGEIVHPLSVDIELAPVIEPGDQLRARSDAHAATSHNPAPGAMIVGGPRRVEPTAACHAAAGRPIIAVRKGGER